MVSLNNLKPRKGSTHRKKRLGCGRGSGHGETSTRGQKGQNSTSGGSKRNGFEGGQTPLLRRIPKSGFNNTRFRTKYTWVNVSVFEKFFEGEKDINIEVLKSRGLIKRKGLLKILGTGDLKAAFNVTAHSFSASAKEKIEKAGGKTVVIELPAKPQKALSKRQELRAKKFASK
ncbi:MAG: 50S ribosomal protein L15 [Elusimicrobiales bacterium]|nr:50S ribosomal protein L15 [Elusimicrobiales bacterium]MCK5106185.1 50S ribosomal protein L15 [Elusimicrobiales bacterium]MCK5583689.1 50S ribosomal protein L15 [Elusimicrobiales bacterium]